SRSAPLIIGGIPDLENQEVNYALELPGMLSFLAHGNVEAEVTGLDQIPEDEHPPVLITHLAFQIMVGLGVFLMLSAVLYFIAAWKKRSWLGKRWFLKLFVATIPMGFIAIEAGWTVTEVGRQPWIIYGIMRTADAVTPMPGIVYSFYLFTAVYISLSAVVVFLLYRQIKMVPELYDRP
ncbi:MAG TPA: cytochrome ubiquinol oxidase subunit I, partial [Anseongella sp.]|nr:cytochrome ubiquinol oxidase subunit I [Anseongella sp.]